MYINRHACLVVVVVVVKVVVLVVVVPLYWDFGNQDTSVGVATRYGVDGPGIEFRWGEISRPDRL